MLTKLIKYDLKSIFKPLIIFYGIMIFLAILGYLLHKFGNSALTSYLYDFCSGAVPGFAAGALINNTLNLWRLFRWDFYADHAYLIRTLPLSSKTLYLSKFFTCLITIFASLAIVVISMLIVNDASAILASIGQFIDAVPHGLFIAILLCLLVYLEIIFAVQVGTTSTILGHYFTKSRFLCSVLIGFAIYGCASTLILLAVFIVALFNPDIMKIFIDDIYNFSATNGLETIFQVVLISTLIYAAFIALSYFVSQKLLARGVDVE